MKTSRILLVWLLPSILCLCATQPFVRTEMRIFPGSMGCSYTYSDTGEGGRSWSTLGIDRGILRSVMHLDTIHPTPFAGFGFGLPDQDHPQGKDFTRFDRVEIELRSPRLQNVGLALITWIPGLTDPQKPMTGMFHEATIGATPIFSTVQVPLSKFAMSNWWPEAAKIGNNIPPTRMDLAKNFEIKMPPGLNEERTDTIEIRSIRMLGTRSWLLGVAGLIGICLSAASWVLLRRRELERFEVSTLDLDRSVPASDSPTLQHRPVLDTELARLELPNRRDLELQALLTWIHSNYHKEDLGVEDASKGSGVGIRRIPQLLKDHAGKSFPAYVAGLRISEACRLLKETDRQVSEIAMAVGFANASHFHRVFKTETGESPSSWREKVHVPPPG